MTTTTTTTTKTPEQFAVEAYGHEPGEGGAVSSYEIVPMIAEAIRASNKQERRRARDRRHLGEVEMRRSYERELEEQRKRAFKVLAVPSAGLRVGVSTPAEVFEQITQLLSDGYEMDQIVWEER